jgi:hypothetical protein
LKISLVTAWPIVPAAPSMRKEVFSKLPIFKFIS